MPKYVLSAKEAEKYLDNTYSSRIYASQEEFIEVQNELKKILMKQGRKGDTEHQTEYEINSDLYRFERSLRESCFLFEKAVEGIKESLWQGEAWRNPNCRKTCPYGTACNKKHTTIDGENYCYGQIQIDIPYKLSKRKKYEIMSEMWFFVFVHYIELHIVTNDKTLRENGRDNSVALSLFAEINREKRVIIGGN